MSQTTGVVKQETSRPKPVVTGEHVKVAFASLIGTAIEWYDFFLYGTAAALVFNKLFFPQFDPMVGTIVAFATFAIGFIARPFGGMVFGHYGDRIGRKKMLYLTLLIMGIGTTAGGRSPDLCLHRYLGAHFACGMPVASGFRAWRRVGRRGAYGG